MSCGKNAYNNRWLIGDGSPSANLSVYQGQRYLDMESYDLYQYLNGKWEVIDNIEYDGTTPFSNIKSVAHRGYSMAAPENTLSAYTLAATAGFKYAECDVSFTKDGVAVLLHDDTINRTSNGEGKIFDLTYEEASTYDYGSWFSSYYEGEKLPKFIEFIELCAELDIHPYIELKNSMTNEQLDILFDIVEQYGLMNNSTWISFNKSYLKWAKDKQPSLRLGYLTHVINDDVIDFCINEISTDDNEVYISCNHANVDESAIKLCKENNLAIEVWTINSKEEINKLDPYITGVTSDYILLLEE